MSKLHRRSSSRGSDLLLAYLIPLVFLGLAIADFQRDGQVDKYIIGVLMIFGLGAAGYRIDTLLEKLIEGRRAHAEETKRASENA